MADLTTILVAGFGAAATVASGLGGYWVAGRNDEARDRRTAEREEVARLAAREEQRHIVQRDVLWDLQDALQRLTRATARILLQDLSTLRERGGLFRLPQEIGGDESLAAVVGVRRLQSRVLAADLRELISSYVTVCTSADLDVMAYQAHRADSTPEELTALIEAKLAEIGTRYEHVIEQLGEHIRRELRRDS